MTLFITSGKCFSCLTSSTEKCFQAVRAKQVTFKLTLKGNLTRAQFNTLLVLHPYFVRGDVSLIVATVVIVENFSQLFSSCANAALCFNMSQAEISVVISGFAIQVNRPHLTSFLVVSCLWS